MMFKELSEKGPLRNRGTRLEQGRAVEQIGPT
jgi:hypothetical protein